MVAEPLIESIPPAEIKAGRVLSDTPAAKAARDRRAAAKASGAVPGKRGRPKGARTARRPARAPRSLYPEIAATLSLVNVIVAMTPVGSVYADPSSQLPDGSFERTSKAAAAFPNAMQIKLGDELDDAEITLLARGLDAQAQRSPRFRRQIERLLGVSSGGQIITAISLIVARRASRHGLAPAMLDPMIGAIIEGGDLAALAAFVPPPTRDDSPETGEVAPREDIDTSDIDGDESGPLPSSFDDM